MIFLPPLLRSLKSCRTLKANIGLDIKTNPHRPGFRQHNLYIVACRLAAILVYTGSRG